MLDHIGRTYGGTQLALVAIEAEDVFSSEELGLIKDLTRVYHGLPGVSIVTSPTNILDIREVKGGIEVTKLVDIVVKLRGDTDKLVLAKKIRRITKEKLGGLRRASTRLAHVLESLERFVFGHTRVVLSIGVLVLIWAAWSLPRIVPGEHSRVLSSRKRA